MIEKFLNAKHWQLFLLTFGISFILQFAMLGLVIVSSLANHDPDSTFMLTYLKLIPIIMILFIVIFFGWFWSVAIGLQPLIPDEVKMKVKKFKIFFFTPLIYIILFSGFIVSTISDNEPNPVVFVAIMPLHLFSMFCMFYTLYFVAKTFKTVELQREVTFSEFAGEFFLIWFYPIGIWFIQPKINRMVEQ